MPRPHCLREQRMTTTSLNCCSTRVCSVHKDSVAAAALPAAVTTVFTQLKVGTSQMYGAVQPLHRQQHSHDNISQ